MHVPEKLRPGGCRLPGTGIRLPRLTRRRLTLLFGAGLVLSEFFVFLALSRLLGLALAVCSGGLGVIARQALAGQVSRQGTDVPVADAALVDVETRLPSRAQLIDQLARDIARSRRYSQDLTLAMIQIARFEDFRASWGAETTRLAVQHVAETLRRVTRSSDFVARIDESHFAVVLLQCDERQAGIFGDRLSLAVSNRPLRSSGVRVPLYVGVDVLATQHSEERFRGPLDFLSAAGGDVMTEGAAGKATRQVRSVAADPQSLRRQLVRDYYPDGQAPDFADAYREHRSRARRVI